ncbi:MAG TPA: hypothetical protein VG889_12165 [Rhizomicrobium sp.]|nr:hypothetical protein [Rhizomicrobium sp.]
MKDFAPYIAPLIIVLLVGRRVLKAQTAQRVRPGRLWIAPAYLAVLMALVMWHTPVPGPLEIAIFAAAVLIGLGVGYMRALHQEFSIEPETGNVMSKASPVGSILFIAIFLVRFGLNMWMNGGAGPDMAHPPSPKLFLYTDAMLFFAFAMVSATAWEVWRRTRPLIAEHKTLQPPSA